MATQGEEEIEYYTTEEEEGGVVVPPVAAPAKSKPPAAAAPNEYADDDFDDFEEEEEDAGEKSGQRQVSIAPEPVAAKGEPVKPEQGKGPPVAAKPVAKGAAPMKIDEEEEEIEYYTTEDEEDSGASAVRAGGGGKPTPAVSKTATPASQKGKTGGPVKTPQQQQQQQRTTAGAGNKGTGKGQQETPQPRKQGTPSSQKVKKTPSSRENNSRGSVASAPTRAVSEHLVAPTELMEARKSNAALLKAAEEKAEREKEAVERRNRQRLKSAGNRNVLTSLDTTNYEVMQELRRKVESHITGGKSVRAIQDAKTLVADFAKYGERLRNANHEHYEDLHAYIESLGPRLEGLAAEAEARSFCNAGRALIDRIVRAGPRNVAEGNRARSKLEDLIRGATPALKANTDVRKLIKVAAKHAPMLTPVARSPAPANSNTGSSNNNSNSNSGNNGAGVNATRALGAIGSPAVGSSFAAAGSGAATPANVASRTQSGLVAQDQSEALAAAEADPDALLSRYYASDTLVSHLEGEISHFCRRFQDFAKLRVALEAKMEKFESQQRQLQEQLFKQRSHAAIHKRQLKAAEAGEGDAWVGHEPMPDDMPLHFADPALAAQAEVHTRLHAALSSLDALFTVDGDRVMEMINEVRESRLPSYDDMLLAASASAGLTAANLGASYGSTMFIDGDNLDDPEAPNAQEPDEIDPSGELSLGERRREADKMITASMQGVTDAVAAMAQARLDVLRPHLPFTLVGDSVDPTAGGDGVNNNNNNNNNVSASFNASASFNNTMGTNNNNMMIVGETEATGGSPPVAKRVSNNNNNKTGGGGGIHTRHATHKPGRNVAIAEVEPAGEAAGLEPGDVIARINGSIVRTRERFHEVVSTLKIGQEADVTVLRGAGMTLTSATQAPITVRVPVSALGDTPQVVSDLTHLSKGGLAGTLKRYESFKSFTGIVLGEPRRGPMSGTALIRDVVAGSPADRAGIKQGELLEAVNGEPCTSKEAGDALMAKLIVGAHCELTIVDPDRAVELEWLAAQKNNWTASNWQAKSHSVGALAKEAKKRGKIQGRELKRTRADRGADAAVVATGALGARRSGAAARSVAGTSSVAGDLPKPLSKKPSKADSVAHSHSGPNGTTGGGSPGEPAFPSRPPWEVRIVEVFVSAVGVTQEVVDSTWTTLHEAARLLHGEGVHEMRGPDELESWFEGIGTATWARKHWMHEENPGDTSGDTLGEFGADAAEIDGVGSNTWGFGIPRAIREEEDDDSSAAGDDHGDRDDDRHHHHGGNKAPSPAAGKNRFATTNLRARPSPERRRGGNKTSDGGEMTDEDALIDTAAAITIDLAGQSAIRAASREGLRSRGSSRRTASRGNGIDNAGGGIDARRGDNHPSLHSGDERTERDVSDDRGAAADSKSMLGLLQKKKSSNQGGRRSPVAASDEDGKNSVSPAKTRVPMGKRPPAGLGAAKPATVGRIPSDKHLSWARDITGGSDNDDDDDDDGLQL